MGRSTQGVRLINLKNKDSIAAVAKIVNEEGAKDPEIDESTGTDLEEE